MTPYNPGTFLSADKTPASPSAASPPAAPSVKPVPPVKPVPVQADLWTHVGENFAAAVDMIKKRRTGEIQSLKTPWEKLNDCGLNGLEWQSTMVICSRPGVGKTMIANQIAYSAHRLNPTQDFYTLHLQFEMLGRKIAERELSAELGRTVKYLNSADLHNPLSDEDLGKIIAYADKQRARQEYMIERPLTPKEIYREVHKFYKKFQKPMLITLDHAGLVKSDATDGSKLQTLYNLGEVITQLKRELPVIWVILSQLNRSLDEAARQEKGGSQANYPIDSDVFGSDALLQHADIMCLFNRPSRYNQTEYGPDRYQIAHKDILAAHFIKVRSGSTRVSFFQAKYENMHMVEIPNPPKKERSKPTPYVPSAFKPL
jgi:replicative DNA helicase